ncbi:MAG: ATP-binding protein [Flavobacteriaceae bacterium]|jgi:predicted AAA+ superfamily ATPase|nr:ATP-binding protein [Flavobacteriaceae bacterium]
MSIQRKLRNHLISKWDSGKVILVTGPRQVGKTTLIHSLCREKGNYLFLNGDDPEDRVLLEDAGEKKLRQIIGDHTGIFIDEAQRIKNIGILLKIIHDRIDNVSVLASGSSVIGLNEEINEPLTGRKCEFNLFPFSWEEMNQHFGYLENQKNLSSYLIYGMYPEVITHPNEKEDILKELSKSYLYKDLLQHKGIRKPELLDKILLALALQVGQEVNYNELANLVRADRSTVEEYISLLEKTYVIFRLLPLSRNIRNEISTSRKIYFYDNGIRNAIIGDFKPLEFRQDIEALWENFMVSERIKKLRYDDWSGRYYFWRTYQQQEIDWIEESDSKFNAFEFKWNPKKGKSKFSKTFLANYPVELTSVISPKNLDEFLL